MHCRGRGAGAPVRPDVHDADPPPCARPTPGGRDDRSARAGISERRRAGARGKWLCRPERVSRWVRARCQNERSLRGSGAGEDASATTSRRRTASWPASTTRTAIRATPRPRSGSRGLARPRCLWTPKRREYELRACSAGGFRRAPRGGGFGDSPTSSATCSAARAADLRGSPAAAARRGCRGPGDAVVRTGDERRADRRHGRHRRDLRDVRRVRRRARRTSRAVSGLARTRAERARLGGPHSGSAPALSWDGTIIDDPCATCHGAGTVQRNPYPVKIPPGVKDGTRVRQAGMGQGGSAAASRAT